MSTFSFGIIHVDLCYHLCYPLWLATIVYLCCQEARRGSALVIVPQVLLDLWCGLVLNLGSALCCLVLRPRGEGVDLCLLLLLPPKHKKG